MEDAVNRIADALEKAAVNIGRNAEAIDRVAAVLERNDCGGIQNGQIADLCSALMPDGGSFTIAEALNNIAAMIDLSRRS